VQAVLRQIRELESGESSSGSPRLIDRDSPTQRELRQAEAEVQRFRAKQADLDEQMARIQARVDLAPRTEQELATLTRDYAQLQEGYVSLLRKERDAEMAEQLEQRWKGERFKVLDPAHFPDKAFFPSRSLFAFLGLVGGLGLGLVSAFAVELLDHSIKNADQLEELFSQPLLATIPHIKPGFPRAGDEA
jgi:uncharacterized protein involved in exopolysaccharide biosynthesis